MKNEFYAQLKEKKETIEAEIKAEAKKIFGEDISIEVGITVHNIPINMMPEGSKPLTSKDIQWLHYNEGVFNPHLYSNHRKFKIVFEDEPVTSIQP